MEETDDICFVCDKTIPSEKWKYQLHVTATKKRNVPVADLIKQLVGEEYAVLVGERDAVCSKCMNLLNVMDSLTADLAEVTNVLEKLLHTKYNLTSDNNNFQVDYDDSIPENYEPVHKCEFCEFSTKYEKEYNIHFRTHASFEPPTEPVYKSFLDELTPPIEPLQMSQNNKTNLKTAGRNAKLQERKMKKPSSSVKKSPSSVPVSGKKRGRKPKKQAVKEKKKKVLFQCSVCEKLFPSEDEIMSHAKEEHGKEKIQVSSEDEYADIQTLESDEDSLTTNNKENFISEELSPSKKNLDFLDDWQDDDDLDELFSPSKKSKSEIIKSKERKKSSDSKDGNDYSDEKDSVSKPTCLFCHAVFFSLEAVQDHIRLNHKKNSFNSKKSKKESLKSASGNFKEESSTSPSKRLFRCNLCGIKKVSLKFIKEHIKTHKKKMALQCKFCGISCRTLTSLKVHASKCNKAASISKKCSLCSLKFFDNKKLKNHIKKVHKTKTPLIKLKGYEVESENETVDINGSTEKKIVKSFKKGIATKETLFKNKLKCSQCNITFDKPSRLAVHMGRHKANTCMAIGICVFCCKAFLNKDQLLLHNQIKHGNISEESKETKCFGCDKIYQHQKDMKVHFMTVHFSEETEKLMKQVSELKSRPDSSDKNDVYNKVFKELQDLTGEGHESEDILPILYNCPVCDFHFKSRSEMDSHISSHNQNYCNICKSLLNNHLFVKHIENHTIESKNVKCSQCEGTFHDDVHLRFHVNQSHPQEMIHKCTMCSETYPSKASVAQHEVTKHGKEEKKVFTCNECDVKFLTEKKYQMHVDYGHRSNLNCKYCDKSFKIINKLSEHEKDHLKQAKNVYKCKICGKVLKTQQALKAHKNNHTSRSQECDVCGQSFKSSHALREHSASHSDTQEKKYFCDICGKGFYFYDSHSRHRRVHLEPLLFQCKICKERFETQQELGEHKESCSMLTNCSECGTRFKTLAELKKHDCPCLNDIEMLP